MRRTMIVVASVVLATAALMTSSALSKRVHRAGEPAEVDPLDLGVGEATAVVASTDTYRPATLAELAALSTVVVEGTVRTVVEGPVVDRGLGLLAATIDVDETYQGRPRRTVEVLYTGYRPDDHEILRSDLALELDPGAHGIWLLRPARVGGAPGAFVLSTSAGQILRTDRGTSVTGGDSEAAAAACRRSWVRIRLLVSAGVSDGAGLVPLAPGAPSPHADPFFAGNPCVGSRPTRAGAGGR
jgi:hypothetical protein